MSKLEPRITWFVEQRVSSTACPDSWVGATEYSSHAKAKTALREKIEKIKSDPTEFCEREFRIVRFDSEDRVLVPYRYNSKLHG